MKCDKCFYKPEDTKYLVTYYDTNLNTTLCFQCNATYNRMIDSLFAEFLKDDFGKCPLSQPDKNLINARKKRSLNQSPWNENELDPKIS